MSPAPFQEAVKDSFFVRHIGVWVLLIAFSLAIGILTYQTWPVLKDPEAAYDKLNSMSCEELATAIAKGSSQQNSVFQHPLIKLMSNFYESKGCNDDQP